MFDWLRPSKNKDVHATTGLLHKYLNFLYQNYAQKCIAENWIREGDLDKEISAELYPNLTLKSLLQNSEVIPVNRPSTFVLQGDKGDGRVFFFRKMITCCLENIPPHMIWEDALSEDKAFRFPVLVTTKAIKEWSAKMSSSDSVAIVSLLCASIIQQSNLQESFEQKLVQNYVQQLIQQGKIALFFEPGTYKNVPEASKIVRELSCIANPIFAIFIEDRGFKPNDPNLQYCIEIDALSETQIANYLSVELNDSRNDWHNMLKQNKELVRILNKPERLLMYIKYAKESKSVEKQKHNVHEKIYQAFVSSEAKKASDNSKRNGKITVTHDSLLEWLQDYARDVQVLEKQDYFDLFYDTDMFNMQDRTFKFEGCKQYLTAKSYYRKSMKGQEVRKAIQAILQTEYPIETLSFFSCLFKNVRGRFNLFYTELMQFLETPEFKATKLPMAPLLAEVLIVSDTFANKCNDFFKWAVDKLDNKTYDSSIFDGFAKLADSYGDSLVRDNLMQLFNDNQISEEVKRRIVYYFSYSRRDFPSALFDTLCSSNQVQQHLKYHIISALIDNYDHIGDGLKARFAELESALGDDCILHSEYETLYALSNPKSNWVNGEQQRACVDKLICKLSTGEYWERAHAAGALSRRSYSRDADAIYAINEMCTVLNEELNHMCNPDKADPNRLRIVSYIVESTCQLARSRPECNADIHVKLIDLLDRYIDVLQDWNVTIEVYYPMQTALALLVAGVQCLTDKQLGLRSNLGKYFSMDEALILDHDFLYDFYQEAYEEQWGRIIEKIGDLKTKSSEEKIEQQFRSENSHLGVRNEFSLICIQCPDDIQFYGFLFAYNHSIYGITCRHNFYKGNKFVDISAVNFTLACQSSAKYRGEMIYPSEIDFNTAFEENASNDIVIFRMRQMPARFSKVIFSEKNLGNLRQGDKVQSFSFIDRNINAGNLYQGEFRAPLGHGFFGITLPEEETAKNSGGFSGAPIVNEKETLFGMWKASRANEKIGIYFSTILKHLKESEESRYNYE